MSSHFSAAPDSDDLVEQLPGEVDEDRGHGLDGAHTNPIQCTCGERYWTARELWNCYYTHEDE
jgi:hypothetical protein